jgi:hypothetical protein
MNDIKREFDTVKGLVLHVLENHPETRSSDNKLYIRCAEYLGAKTLSDLEHINLNLVSVHKIRQQIQNKMGLFKPDESVVKARGKREIEIKEYMIAN